MKNFFVGCCAVLAALVSVNLLIAQAPAPGAAAGKGGGKGRGGRGPATPTGPAPHLPDGTPDFSGLWQGGGSNSTDEGEGLLWCQVVFRVDPVRRFCHSTPGFDSDDDLSPRISHFPFAQWPLYGPEPLGQFIESRVEEGNLRPHIH